MLLSGDEDQSFSLFYSILQEQTIIYLFILL